MESHEVCCAGGTHQILGTLDSSSETLVWLTSPGQESEHSIQQSRAVLEIHQEAAGYQNTLASGSLCISYSFKNKVLIPN